MKQTFGGFIFEYFIFWYLVDIELCHGKVLVQSVWERVELKWILNFKFHAEKGLFFLLLMKITLLFVCLLKFYFECIYLDKGNTYFKIMICFIIQAVSNENRNLPFFTLLVISLEKLHWKWLCKLPFTSFSLFFPYSKIRACRSLKAQLINLWQTQTLFQTCFSTQYHYVFPWLNYITKLFLRL